MVKKLYLFQLEVNYYKLLLQKNFLFHQLVEEAEELRNARELSWQQPARDDSHES